MCYLDNEVLLKEKKICINKHNHAAAPCSERQVQIKSKKESELPRYHDFNFNFVLVMLMFSYIVYLPFTQTS